MSLSPDYSRCSLEFLRFIVQQIDREKYPRLYAEVTTKIQQREAQIYRETARERFWSLVFSFFAHGLPGFVVGLMIHAVYAANIMNDTLNCSKAVELQFIGLLIPLLMTLFGFVVAVLRPIALLKHVITITGFLILGALTGMFDLFVLYLTSMCGYC